MGIIIIIRTLTTQKMKFTLFLIAAAQAVTLQKDAGKNWPGAYRENNNFGVDVNFDGSAHFTPSMITANRKMPDPPEKEMLEPNHCTHTTPSLLDTLTQRHELN